MTRRLLAFVLSLAFVGGQAAKTSPIERVLPRPTYVDHALDEERSLVEATVESWFSVAGLDLPDVEVRWDCDPESRKQATDGPRNVAGVYVNGGDTHICMFDTSARSLAHEWGHAYDFAYLTDAERHEFLHMFELDVWLDSSTPYADRGGEEFARFMSWWVGVADKSQSPFFDHWYEAGRYLQDLSSSGPRLTTYRTSERTAQVAEDLLRIRRQRQWGGVYVG